MSNRVDFVTEKLPESWPRTTVFINGNEVKNVTSFSIGHKAMGLYEISFSILVDEFSVRAEGS